MKICLAGPSAAKFLGDELYRAPFYLESFISMREWLIPLIKDCEFFLLDSGAFSFMSGKERVDFDEYLDRYIQFIRQNNIEHFFELDLDSVIGLEKVENLRRRLEDETGRRCIPVWHKSRGKEYFIRMCEEYDYVAIGGIAGKEITKGDYPYFHWFIDTAHRNNCKIHGLGFTSLSGIYEYPFDSVDSTSWVSGSRFGTLYHFNGRKLVVVDTDGMRKRTDIDSQDWWKSINRHNYYEWIKFQRYADANL